MIGWLKGEVRHRFQRGHRHHIVLACSNIGYEVQLIQRDLQALAPDPDVELWVHQVVSADNLQLFGFRSIAARDLFRDLIAVSGVGPQAGMALLEACEIDELVTALIHSDHKTLCRAQGVGKRTAERLALELRSKLVSNGGESVSAMPAIQEAHLEVISTLESLGYEPPEIRKALQQLDQDASAPAADDTDAWLRRCIQLISNAAP